MTSRPRDAFFATLFVVAAFASAGARAQEPAPDDTQRAAELAQRALEHYEAGAPDEAIPLLLEARELYAEPLLTYNLARAYEALGRDEEALAAYQRYVDERPDAPDRAAMETHIAALEAKIAEREQLAREREDERRRREAAEARAAEADALSPWPFVIVSAGAATLGAGVVFGVLAKSERDSALDASNHELRVARGEESERLATIANVLFAVGGALAVAGGSWMVVELVRRDDDEDRPATLTLAPAGLGLSLDGTF